MALRVGRRVPDFVLPDSNKKDRKLSELLQNGSLVLAFFPFAFSGVCDKEMCTFRDGIAELTSLRAQVVGVSVDSLFTLKAFAQTYGIEFPLLSDFNKKVTRSYGVLEDTWVGFGYRGVSKRAVFVIDRKGVLRYRWIAGLPTEEPPYDQLMTTLARLN